MAGPFERARIRWIRDAANDDAKEYDVRTISVRAMFVKMSDPPKAGTRGRAELLDRDGNPVIVGTIRVVFTRPDSGVGVEFLDTRTMPPPAPGSRRSARPTTPPHIDAMKIPKAPRIPTARPTKKPTSSGPPAPTPTASPTTARPPSKTPVPDKPRAPTPIRPTGRPPSKTPVPSIPRAPTPLASTPPPRKPTTRPPPPPKSSDELPADAVVARETHVTGAPPLTKRSRSKKPTAVGVPQPVAEHQRRKRSKKQTIAGMAPIVASPPAVPDEALSLTDEAPVLELDSDVPLELPTPTEVPPAPDEAASEPSEASEKPEEPEEREEREEPEASGEFDLPMPDLGDLSDLEPPPPPAPAADDFLSKLAAPAMQSIDLGDDDDDDYPELELEVDLPPPSGPSVIIEPQLLEEARRLTHPPPPKAPKQARLSTRVKAPGAGIDVAIGIDLGTSNTCVSAVLDGRPQVIPTRWGTTTIPSMLSIIDGRVMVGHAAAKRSIMNPESTIYGSKRLLGRTYSADVHEEFQAYFAYPLTETDDHRFGAALPDRVVSFQEVAERLLAEVREVAEHHLGKSIDLAVVTVPAYFGETQREAVRTAAKDAGLTVGRIVNEPTAAAVAYGYQQQQPATLVVFDLGGGTFDVSVLKVEARRFEVLATGGDAFLGGIDVDDILAKYLLEEFMRAERATFEPDSQQLARLRDAAEECKRGLSMQHKFAVYLPHFATIDGKPRHLQVAVEQSTLNDLTTDFCDRLVDITESVLAEQGMSPRDVDDVLLVGGGTRLPRVQERVEELFEKRASKRINPDEAVALGAALLSDESGLVDLLDVLPIAIGYSGQGRRFTTLIGKNTSVPVSRAFTVRTTGENQVSFPMPIFQGERMDAAENEYLGTVRIEGIPEGPAGSELELTLSLDDQCLLHVAARHVASDQGLDVVLERDRSVEEVIRSLGRYEGEVEAPVERRRSALGTFFAKVRGIFKKKK